MRFLADESCDGRVVRALRSAGHDVRSAVDGLRGAPDTAVSAAAFADARVVLTEDRDFGHLVFVAGWPSVGTVLVRWPADDRDGIAHRLVEVVSTLGDRILGSFTVVQPTGVRSRRIGGP